MIKPVHPFPARMAPELAFRAMGDLPSNSVVLDPMVGSGTVLRQAIEFGHSAIGYDVDPLAVLMSNVWASKADVAEATEALSSIVDAAMSLANNSFVLQWLDNDEETLKFVDFWFAERQKQELRRLSYAISICKHSAAVVDVLKLGLSRIIVTKERAASLARDTSHSRPHRVTQENDFDVFGGFKKAVNQILKRLSEVSQIGSGRAFIGDARSLLDVDECSVDAVVTSPPYLNAIDYMRGHKLALVWLGYTISELRIIRSGSIGAEKSLSDKASSLNNDEVMLEMGDLQNLPQRDRNMIFRYVDDMGRSLSEVERVLKPRGTGIFVVGNSCLKGVFIRNSQAVISAAVATGLEIKGVYEREIPSTNRYLPITGSQLGKRMRTETIISLQKPA
ncbi:hypothetical protein [Phyllobacterium myrsinacearum]|uniref:site-specific DNA-methyltransferase (cytosine-N(4)-specific) n=1 Tax=Phyllobacterium myrsinacearum TaxID=28101 RepID=A0A2S9JIV2_9HYPH|nr:hypothetical protein [Phyllobacterium myrsinacearum]PRD53029.1 hypothetical protein C5750_11490 [Phyllobacterium myrsinacearum]PWV94132.1 hypothetical protein DEV92_103309 [Phyllobacterium myrsinacearum]RZV07429.1 hypothetical protein EV654_2099 [Phyllobacterium myrsinacearum]